MVFTVLFDTWAAMMWRACWQGSLIVLAVWLICRLLPLIPARLQCWFWRLAVLKFMIVLLLPSLLDLPLLPSPPLVAPEIGPQVATGMPARPMDHVAFSPGRAIAPPSLPAFLCFAWIIGVGWSLACLLAAWHRARQLRKQSHAIDCLPLTEQLTIQGRLFGLRTLPKLLGVAGGGSPMLMGILCPIIVMPARTLRRLSASEQAVVLGHELAHIRRGDLFWGLAASLVRAVFFFHPLVWFSERQLRLAQEIAADELVIGQQHHDPVSYGSLLVSVVGKLGPRQLLPTISMGAAGPVHSLTRRLVAMTRIGRTSRRVVAISGALLGAVVLLGIVPWRLVAAESEKADQRPSGRLAESEPLAATPPVHLEFKLYAIDILEGGTRLAAVNKLTGERRLLEVPRNTRVTNAIAGDDVAVCTMRGTPISQLILYNRRMGKWSTFPLPMCVRPLLVQNHESDNPLEACACVGDSMVCYQLKDRAVAYSGTNDKWGVLATNAEPAVGDDFIMVNSAIENSVFTATSGVWVTVKAPAVTRR